MGSTKSDGSNSDGFVEVGPPAFKNKTLPTQPPPIPPPYMEKEPRFPFFHSAARRKQLLEQKHQAEAFSSFKLVARQTSSQPTGFYGPNSSSDSGSEVEEVDSDSAESHACAFDQASPPRYPSPTSSLAEQRELFAKMVDSSAPRPRRNSDVESVGSAVTTASINVIDTVEKYLDKLEARLKKNNPLASEAEVCIMLIDEARAAHERATARQQEVTKPGLKMLEDRVKSQQAQASPDPEPAEKVKSQIEPAVSSTADLRKNSPRPAPPYVDKGKQAVRPTYASSLKSHQKMPVSDAPRVDVAPKHDDSLWGTPPPAEAPENSWGTKAEDAEVDDWAELELPASKEPPLLPHPPRKIPAVTLDSAAADDADDEDFTHVQAKSKKAKHKYKNTQHVSDFLGNHESTLPRSSYYPEIAELPYDPDRSQPNFGPLGQSKPEQSTYRDPYEFSDEYESSDEDDPTRWNITNVSQRRFLAKNPHGEEEMLQHYMCNFEGCGYKCLKVKAMLNHKIEQHFPCVKCDLDFANYDALFAHKQATSIHVVCWQCGADFATTPARNRHMESFHPDDKEICCPGCGELHPNQTSFIMHLELKLCKQITDEQWNKARLMVGKMKELALIEYAENEKKEKDAKRAAANIAKGLPADHEEDYGLPGLDLRKAALVTKFPGLPRPDENSTTAVGATSTLVQKLKTINPNDPMAVVSLGPSEQRLYMLYQRMVGASSGQQILPEDKNGNVVYAGVPGHELYDPGYFFNRHINMFLCPQSFCGKRFKTADALDAHMRSPVHMDNDLRCPECADGFRTASALMAHLEAPSVNCYIRNSDIYKEALEVASGAFLSTTIGEDGKMKVIAQEPSW